MTKISWKPGTMLAPVPPVMVTCGTMEKPNVLTIAWTGIVNSEPPMTYISVRPSRYSHNIIKESGEFVINVTTLEQAKACDYCGVKSGKNTDKIKEMNLEIEACKKVAAPMLSKATICLECKVKSVSSFKTHDMFLAESSMLTLTTDIWKKTADWLWKRLGCLLMFTAAIIRSDAISALSDGRSTRQRKTKPSPESQNLTSFWTLKKKPRPSSEPLPKKYCFVPAANKRSERKKTRSLPRKTPGQNKAVICAAAKRLPQQNGQRKNTATTRLLNAQKQPRHDLQKNKTPVS